MGIVKRQSIKATIVTYVGIVFAYVNILYLWPLCLNPEQVGLLRLLPDIALILGIFIRLGTGNSALRFFPRFKNADNGHNGLLFNILFFPTVAFLLFCVVFLFAKDVLLSSYLATEPLLNKYIFLLLPVTLFSVYNANLDVYTTLHLRIVVPTLIREVIARGMLTVIILLFYWQLFSFDVLVALYVATFAIMTLLLVAYIAKLRQLHLRPNLPFLKQPELKKEIINYSAMVTLGGLGTMLATKIDTVMVTLYAANSLADTGIFSTAALIAMVIEMPKRTINQIAGPIVTEHVEKNETAALENFYKRSSDTQFLAGLFLFLGIWLNIDSMFGIMPNGDLYRAGKFVILYIGISKLFDMVTSINSSIINNSKYYRFSLTSMVFLAVLGILLNMLLIPPMGLTGAAVATAISLFLYNLLCVGFVYKKFGIHPFSRKTLQALFSAVAVFLLVTWLPHVPSPYLDILLRGSLITVTFGALAYFLRISEDINAVIDRGLHLLKIKR